MILAIVDDLMFRAKIESAATQLRVPIVFSRDASTAESSVSRVLIDLNLSQGDPLAIIREMRITHPRLSIVGYCSHVQQELQQQALEAGCTTVLPRSAFVQQLPQLLVDTAPTT